VIDGASCICELGRGWLDSGGVYVGYGASSYGLGPSFWARDRSSVDSSAQKRALQGRLLFVSNEEDHGRGSKRLSF